MAKNNQEYMVCENQNRASENISGEFMLVKITR